MLFRGPEPKAVLYLYAKEYQHNVLESIPVHYGTGQEIFESTSKLYRRTSHGRPQVRVTTGDSLYHLLEWGSVNNPPYAPFRKGAEATGLLWFGN
jgi:hypothetical protein